MSEFNTARRNGSLKYGYDFNNSTEVVKLFGPEVGKSAFASGFKIPGFENRFCWLVKENGGNKWHNIPKRGLNFDGRGYRQIVEIKEYNEDVEVSKARVEKELVNPVSRYVFWNEENAGASFFKFHGVFTLDIQSTRALMETGEYACIYVLRAEDGECPRATYDVREFTSEEVEGLAGKKLVIELLTDLERADGENPDVRMWPGDILTVKEAVAKGDRLVCETADDIKVIVPKRELELGYMRAVEADSQDADDVKTTTCCVTEEFGKFWEEISSFFGLDDGEDLTIKRGSVEYTLRCGWNEWSLIVAMVSPMSLEWDYAQLYRGMFGWGDVGDGFYEQETRRKVTKLLLDEISRREEWMKENPGAAAERDGELKAVQASEGEDGEESPVWLAKYRWIRNEMMQPGEGDLRLYVKGDNHLWGSRVHCEWAQSDLRK